MFSWGWRLKGWTSNLKSGQIQIKFHVQRSAILGILHEGCPWLKFELLGILQRPLQRKTKCSAKSQAYCSKHIKASKFKWWSGCCIVTMRPRGTSIKLVTTQMRMYTSTDISFLRDRVVSRKCGTNDCLKWTTVECNVIALFRGGRNQRTFYGSKRGSRAVQGFKLRPTILYIEVLIYRMVTSLELRMPRKSARLL